jgi:hypothetical protein
LVSNIAENVTIGSVSENNASVTSVTHSAEMSPKLDGPPDMWTILSLIVTQPMIYLVVCAIGMFFFPKQKYELKGVHFSFQFLL